MSNKAARARHIIILTWFSSQGHTEAIDAPPLSANLYISDFGTIGWKAIPADHRCANFPIA